MLSMKTNVDSGGKCKRQNSNTMQETQEKKLKIYIQLEKQNCDSNV